MNAENSKKLYDKYPGLFHENPVDFACNDGWFDLLNRLCGILSSYAGKEDNEYIRFGQVKEKFGLLRIYLDFGDDITPRYRAMAEGAAEMVESASGLICEQCGEKGQRTKKGGWINTLCPKCGA